MGEGQLPAPATTTLVWNLYFTVRDRSLCSISSHFKAVYRALKMQEMN